MSIRIDEEFEKLIPPLTREEFKQLEENILTEGIRDPLVVWHVPSGDDILIDGHNRWKISVKHAGIRFEIVKKRFQDRTEAKIWIIKNQIGRRNLSTYARSELVVMHLEPMLKEKAKAQQVRKSADFVSQKSVEQKPIDTQKELAKAAGVSHDTIHKVKTIMKKGDEETKERLRKNDPSISINKAFTNIMAAEHETKQQEAARELKEAKKRHEEYSETKTDGIVSFTEAKQDKEDSKLISKDFCKYFYDKGYGIDLINIEIKNKGLDYLLSGATEGDIYELENHLRRWQKNIIHIQKLLAERRMNGKQF